MQKLSTKLPLDLLQTQWSQPLNKLLKIPFLNGISLTSVSLTASTPKAIQINLGRTQQGWFLTDNTTNSTVWRTAPLNASTLTLESSADTVISLWVF